MRCTSKIPNLHGWLLRPARSCLRACRLIGLAVAFTPGIAASELPEPAPLEYQVKAAFVMNFARFVEWPPDAFADAATPLTMCTLGDDVLGPALEQMVAGETVNGRKLVVQRLIHPPVPAPCRLLFIGGLEKHQGQVLAALGRNVLTVGEGDLFLREGGMIAFAIDRRRVRFDINQSAAQSAGLKISSQLLKVARTVEK